MYGIRGKVLPNLAALVKDGINFLVSQYKRKTISTLSAIKLNKNILNAAVLLLVITVSPNDAKPVRRSIDSSNSINQHSLVTLYSDTNFKGFKTELRVSQFCVNLPGALNDAASSVEADGGCIILCEHSLCRGHCEQVEYFNSDLSMIGLNDIVSSIKTCM